MDWTDERWVKLYTRDTTDWLALSWQAQGLFVLILRKVNRAGVIDLGRAGKRGLAAHIGGGSAWASLEPHLDELLADGCVTFDGIALRVPNFVTAQTSIQSDKARKRAERERATDLGRDEQENEEPKRDVTKRDGESQDVTGSRVVVTRGHDASRDVTNRETRSEEIRTDSPSGSAEGATAPDPTPTVVPTSGERPTTDTAKAPDATTKGNDAKPAKRKRAKAAPTPDTIPAPGTLARRVFEAIVGDRALCAITANPGDASERWADPATYPGVDVLAEVKRAAEWSASHPGRYNDGRAFLRGWLQRKADEIARAPKPAAPRVPDADGYINRPDPPRPPQIIKIMQGEEIDRALHEAETTGPLASFLRNRKRAPVQGG